jgi:hypothetical protein
MRKTMKDKKNLKCGNVKQSDIFNVKGSGIYTFPIEQLNTKKIKTIGKNNLIIVLKLLLKWQYQPEQQSGEIKASIRQHRYQIRDDLKFSPSFKNYLSEIWLESYREARLKAADETDLAVEIFPEQCPYTIEKILNTDYLP